MPWNLFVALSVFRCSGKYMVCDCEIRAFQQCQITRFQRGAQFEEGNAAIRGGPRCCELNGGIVPSMWHQLLRLS